MAITFVPNFQHKTNIVLPLVPPTAQGATLRVCSGVSSEIGRLTITGASTAKNVVVKNNPSWLNWTMDTTDNNVVVFTVSGAAQDTRMFNFYVLVQDGSTDAYYPLSIEVRPPFVLKADSPSYTLQLKDPTVSDVVLRGYGEQGSILPSPNVFINPPSTMPAGMNFVSGDGASAKLRVNAPSLTNLSGGVTSVATSCVIPAYAPGTMYDTPERVFNTTLTFASLGTKIGVYESALTCQWDFVHGYFALNLIGDFVGGAPIAGLQYLWECGNAISKNGTVGGGTSGDTTMTWIPTTEGISSFKVTVKTANGQTLATHTLDVPSGLATDANWSDSTTNAIRLGFDKTYDTNFSGTNVTFTISALPADLGTGDTNVVFTLKKNGVAVATGAPASMVLNTTTPSRTVTVALPTSLSIKQKFVLEATATNGVRTGRTSTAVVSKGPADLVVTGSTNLTLGTGRTLPTTAYAVTANGSPVSSGLTFELIGAPAGLLIDNQGNLSGKVHVAGSYNFQVLASLADFTPTILPVALTVNSDTPRLTVNSLIGPTTAQVDNTQFVLSWGYQGKTSSNLVALQRNSDQPVDVSSKTSFSSTIIGNSVFSLWGSDFAGTAYTLPLLVASQTSVQVTRLPNAYVSGTLDSSNMLKLGWAPIQVGNNSLYKGWNIFTKVGTGTPNQQLINGVIPTGLENGGTTAARQFSVQMVPGTSLGLDMYAVSSDQTVIADGSSWGQYLQFPPSITDATFSLDKTTASKGESITVTLDSGYIGADTWSIDFGDGTKMDPRPLSAKSTATTYSQAGNKLITITVRSEYPDQNASLCRTITKTVYVQDQVYIPTNVQQQGSLGSIGIGGEKGFELSSAKDGVSPSEAYEVIVKALVADQNTQEIKLLVATSRTRDASSLLGTMALDVFPLVGRPHLKDVVLPNMDFPTRATESTTPIKISTTTLPEVVVGKPMSDFYLSATGGDLPYSWYSDNLPLGVRLSIDGTLGGTVLQAGSYALNLSVKDAHNPASLDQVQLLLSAKSDIQIQSTTLPDAQVGTAYSAPITVLGGLPPYNFTVGAGAFPLGLTLEPSTGIVSGIPVTYNSLSDFLTPYTTTVEVTDAVGSKASAHFSMGLTPMSLTLGDVDQTSLAGGLDYRLVMPISGGQAPYQVVSVVSDALVDNLRVLNPDTIVALSGVNATALQIVSKDQVQTISEVTGISTYPINFTVAATGGTPTYSFSKDLEGTTTLPRFNISATGVVTGTVTFTSGDDLTKIYTVAVKVADSQGKTATASLKVTINIISIVVGSGSGNYSLRVVEMTGALSGRLDDMTFATYGPSDYQHFPGSSTPGVRFGSDGAPAANQYWGLALWDDTNNVRADVNLTSWGVSLTGPSIKGYNYSYDQNSPRSIPFLNVNLYGDPAATNPKAIFVMDGIWTAPVGHNILSVSAVGIDPTTGTTKTYNGLFGFGLGSAEAGNVQNPVITSTPSLNVVAQRTSNPDGSSTWSQVTPCNQQLNALGGVAPYTYALVSSDITGMAVSAVDSRTGVLSFGPTTINLASLPASGTVGNVVVSVTDGRGLSSRSTFRVLVTVTSVSNFSLSIVSNTMPALIESGKAASGVVNFSAPATNVNVTGITGLTLTRVTDSQYSFSGPISGSGTYAVSASALADATKTCSQNYTLSTFTKAIRLVCTPPSAIPVSSSFTVASGTSFLRAYMDGYAPSEAGALSWTTPLANNVVMRANPAVDATVGGVPGCYVDLDLTTGATVGAVAMMVKDATHSPQVSSNPVGFSVTAPIMTVTGRTDTVSLEEYAVVPGNGGSCQAVLAYPVDPHGGTAPYRYFLVGNNNPSQWAIYQTTDGTALQFDFTNVGFQGGQTRSVDITCDVQDSLGVTVRATGTITISVIAANYIYAVNNHQTLNFTPGTSGVVTWKQGAAWTVLKGHPPYTFDVLSTVGQAILLPSPSKREMAYNNSAYVVVRKDLDSQGNETGSSWSQPIGATLEAGVWPTSATVKITDSKGLTGTLLCSADFTSIIGPPCPAPEVLILMADGSSCPAGELLAGDLVWTKPENGGDYAAHRVLEATPEKNFRARLSLKDGREMVFSINHRFSTGLNEWTEVQNLVVGQTIQGKNPGEVLSVELLGMGEVIRISVEGAHTYETGGLLSHNIKAQTPPPAGWKIYSRSGSMTYSTNQAGGFAIYDGNGSPVTTMTSIDFHWSSGTLYYQGRDANGVLQPWLCNWIADATAGSASISAEVHMPNGDLYYMPTVQVEVVAIGNPVLSDVYVNDNDGGYNEEVWYTIQGALSARMSTLSGDWQDIRVIGTNNVIFVGDWHHNLPLYGTQITIEAYGGLNYTGAVVSETVTL